VVFYANAGVHRVRTSGGPVELLHPTIGTSGIEWSPDSRTIAYITAPARGERTRHLAVVTPGAATRRFQLPPAMTGGFRFTADGAGIVYGERNDGTTLIHVQPVDGSPPRVTASAALDLDGQLSRDGSKVAVMRQRVDSDVVLLRDRVARGQ
jgi:Tol biopolymer transport system component